MLPRSLPSNTSLVGTLAYLFCDLLFAVKGAMSQEQGRILALLTLPFLFPAVHIIYGIGTIAGLLSGKG